MCHREEPPRDESGLRAHGSNQRFHRLLGHAVARALTTAPRLTGLGPAAPGILIHHGWRRKGRPGRCRANEGRCVRGTTRRCVDPPLRPVHQMLDVKRRIYRRFTSRIDPKAARAVIEPQTGRHQPALRDSHATKHPSQCARVQPVGVVAIERCRSRRTGRFRSTDGSSCRGQGDAWRLSNGC